MSVTKIRAVLFAKDLDRVVGFYVQALGMQPGAGDEHHAVLSLHGFELIVHTIPRHIAQNIRIDTPPVRREGGAIRLDYPVASIEHSRSIARRLDGEIDAAPPPWSEPDANFFLGGDPEGNVFGVSQQASK